MFSISAFSQVDSTKHKCPKNIKEYQTFYFSAGESFSIAKDLTTGFQFGSWGINNNDFCYAATLDYTYNLSSGNRNVFVGFAPQYYFLNKRRGGMYCYGAPKFQVYNAEIKKFDYLLEVGIGGYYNISEAIVLQYGISSQAIYSNLSNGGVPLVPSFGLSINYINIKQK